MGLVKITPASVINTQTTGSQPRGYSCLHFACDGSDKTFRRGLLARALLEKRADIEARCAGGNTPLLLASGTGVSDTVRLLITARADVTAQNDRQMGALEKARGSSGDMEAVLTEAQAPMTEATSSGRTRTGISEQRQIRYVRAAQDPDASERRSRGKGGKRGRGGKGGKTKASKSDWR